MPLRLCLGFRGLSCSTLTDDPSSRCPIHKPMQEAARRPTPSARARGYDARHDATRAMLLPLAYGKPCPRCGEPMLQGQALDLGHLPGQARATHPGSRGQRIEHARCNRRAGLG